MGKAFIHSGWYCNNYAGQGSWSIFKELDSGGYSDTFRTLCVGGWLGKFFACNHTSDKRLSFVPDNTGNAAFYDC